MANRTRRQKPLRKFICFLPLEQRRARSSRPHTILMTVLVFPFQCLYPLYLLGERHVRSVTGRCAKGGPRGKWLGLVGAALRGRPGLGAARGFPHPRAAT